MITLAGAVALVGIVSIMVSFLLKHDIVLRMGVSIIISQLCLGAGGFLVLMALTSTFTVMNS